MRNVIEATLSIGLVLAIAMIFAIPAIDRYERANDYPFGRMCNSVFTFYNDTCN